MERDADLLGAWRGGDEAAGQRLCERHYTRVARFFRKELADDTGDAVQETFLACVERKDQIRDDRAFRNYLFGIAYRVLQKHLQRRYNLREDQLDFSSIHDVAPGLSTIMYESERRRILTEALSRIPVNSQKLLELTYWEGMSSKDIHEVMGIPASTIRDRRRRAAKELEEVLREMNVADGLLEQTISEFADVVKPGGGDAPDVPR